MLKATLEKRSSASSAHERMLSLSAVIERERRVLSQIAAGVPLGQVLEELLRAVEAQSGKTMLTSVLFLSEDGQHMLHGAAPSLPRAYNAAIDGISIGEGVGSCGTAAARGTPVYASDIATDPLWKDFCGLALQHGLRACWSTPIRAANSAILGTFAIYYAEPRAPTTDDIEAISVITQTTALAIERHLSDKALKRSQDELRHLNQTLAQQVEIRTRERDLLASVVETTDVMFMALDRDYTILGVNKANADEFERIYGLRPKAGDNILALLADQPEHQAQVRAGWGRGLSGEEITVVEDFGDPDRARPYYEIKFRNLHNGKGERIGSYQFVTDVTERLRSQAELGQVQDALRQAQKMEAVGQLTGGVAHDFNNFLTVMRSSTDLLKRPDLPEERRQRYITAISETVDRAAKLTAQLLAFARRQALQPTVFDVGAGISSLTGMLATLTGSRIEIVTDLPDTSCFINADPSQFDTAIVNMVVNARDAMSGEGRLTISVHPIESIPAVRSHAPVSGDFVAVCIEDTGSGIAPADIERIFEPFFTTKDVGQGTGLGLSQVFGFAKQSGGEVRVQSEVGKGTMFVLYLSRVDAEAAPLVAEPEPLMDGHGTCVLVVEDNIEVGTFATQTLAELGYETVWATNAEAALTELAKDAVRFDVVFSDVVMPGMNGIDLGHEIRRLYHDLPVVLASGYSHVLAQNGTYGFELLHKPYSIEQLSRTLRKVASWRRSKRILAQ